MFITFIHCVTYNLIYTNKRQYIAGQFMQTTRFSTADGSVSPSTNPFSEKAVSISAYLKWEIVAF